MACRLPRGPCVPTKKRICPPKVKTQNRTRTITKAFHGGGLPPHFPPILPPDGGVNDIVNLTIFNMSAWIIPMATVGRAMGMDWKDLSVNLAGLGMFRSAILLWDEFIK